MNRLSGDLEFRHLHGEMGITYGEAIRIRGADMEGKSGRGAFKQLTRSRPLLVVLIVLMIGVLYLGGRAAVSAFAQSEALIGRRIIIDAGHGGFDSGAIGVSSKVHEDKLNLAVAKNLREVLTSQGADVGMTRETDEAVAGTKMGDMNRRRELIDAFNADISISIHMNKYFDKSAKGPQVFYMAKSVNGEKLASAIQKRLNKLTSSGNRKHSTGDYYVLRTVKPTAVIVECGFLSNPGEEGMLQSKAYQEKLARSITDGIVDYFAALE